MPQPAASVALLSAACEEQDPGDHECDDAEAQKSRGQKRHGAHGGRTVAETHAIAASSAIEDVGHVAFADGMLLLVVQPRLIDPAILVEPPHERSIAAALDDSARREPRAVRQLEDQCDEPEEQSRA